MIQIPITLPKWNTQDIINLVRDFVEKGITDDKYKQALDENIDLISTAIENNPREIKRFLNNFIVAYEIFSPKKNVVPKELLVIQAVQLRWASFYDLLIKSGKTILAEVSKYLEFGDDKRSKELDSDEQTGDEDFNMETRKVLRNFKESDLWDFLKKNFGTLSDIKDWNIYRRATEVGIEPTEVRIDTDLQPGDSIDELSDSIEEIFQTSRDLKDIIMRTNRRNKLTKLQIERFVSSMDEMERLFVRMKNTKNFKFKREMKACLVNLSHILNDLMKTESLTSTLAHLFMVFRDKVDEVSWTIDLF